MQKPIFFEHEIVNENNMEFLTSSIQTTIGENMAVFTNGEPGVVSGYNITGNSLDGFFTVSPGVAYTRLGERLELFSSTNVNITQTGTSNVYAKLSYFNYDPELGPSSLVTQKNPDTGSDEAVEQYNGVTFVFSSGTGDDTVLLGSVTANSVFQYVTSETSSADILKLAGFINLYNQTVDGSVLQTGTVDSTSFRNPLSASFVINTGVNITSNASGSSNIGSAAKPLSNVYSMTGTFHQINGMSPIIIDSLQLKPSASIESPSASEKLSLDSSGRGTTFGSTIYTTGVSVLQAGNMEISTPSGNITIKSYSGNVSIQSNTDIVGTLTVSEPAAFNDGFSVAGGSTLDFSDVNVIMNQSNFSTKNLLSNSDFSMGVPTYYNGSTLFNSPGASNFKSGLTIFSPWDARYSGTLSPYNWSFTDNISVKLGTSESNNVAQGINEVQRFVFNNPVIPNTGSFYVTYTGIAAIDWPAGPPTTGTYGPIPFDITATGLQAILSAFSNIGSGNLSVAGDYVNGYTVTFVSGLGFKNLPLLSFSGITVASGITPVPSVTWLTGTTDGYTPVSYYSVYKEPTAYTTVGVGGFARISGSSISTTGTLATQIQDAKPGKEYNLSFYYKNNLTTPTDRYLKLSAGIFTNISGIGTGTFVSIDKTNESSDWQRVNVNITAPTSGTGLYAVIKLEPSGVSAVSPFFDIAAVQLTEGPNLFAYNNNSPTTFSLYSPSGVAYPSSHSVDTTSLYAYTVSSIYITQPFMFVSGSFYSDGGIYNINSTVNMLRDNAGSSAVGAVNYYASVNMDGNPVYGCHFRSVNSGGVQAVWAQLQGNRTLYIPRGSHTITLGGRVAGGAGDNLFISLSGTQPEMGIFAPKIDITKLS